MGSKSYTSTNISDQRLVTGEGSAGITGDGSSINYSITQSDQGAIASAADIVKSALKTVEATDATAGEGFSKVLDLAGSLFSKNFAAFESSQQGVASAYQTAQETQGLGTGQ